MKAFMTGASLRRRQRKNEYSTPVFCYIGSTILPILCKGHLKGDCFFFPTALIDIQKYVRR